MHIDVDPAEINKNKEAHIPMCADTKPALQAINKALDAEDPQLGLRYEEWRDTLEAVRAKHPMVFPERDDVIIPQRAIQVCESEP